MVFFDFGWLFGTKPAVTAAEATGAGIVTWFARIIIGLIIIGALVTLYFWWDNHKKYRYAIKVWGMRDGNARIIDRDRGGYLKVGKDEFIFRLRKNKRIIPPPQRDFDLGKEMWLWYRKDGELVPEKPSVIINPTRHPIRAIKEKIGIPSSLQMSKDASSFIPMKHENLDKKFAELQVKFIDEDMRLARVNIAKTIKESFSLRKFWEKYQVIIMSTIFMVVFVVCIIMFFESLKSVNAGVAKLAQEVARYRTAAVHIPSTAP